MLNFKGNINNGAETSEPRYTCPDTGAHFEFNNICTRIEKMGENRERRRLAMLSASSIASHRKSSLDDGSNKKDQDGADLFVREESSHNNESSSLLQLTDSARKTVSEDHQNIGEGLSATKKKMLIIEEAAYADDNLIISQSPQIQTKNKAGNKTLIDANKSKNNNVLDAQKSVEVVNVTQSFNPEALKSLKEKMILPV